MKLQTSWVVDEWVAGHGSQYQRRNPANIDDVAGEFAAATEGDVERAIAGAVSAQHGWADTPAPKRGEVLQRAAEVVRHRVDTIAEVLTREEGKTLAEARGEVLGGASILSFIGGGGSWGFDGRLVEGTRQNVLTYTRRHPLGVVAAITPWNFPFSNPCIKLASALVAGNSVVWKPASYTSGTALELTACLTEAGLPGGVLSTLLGGGSDVGNQIAMDRRVAALSFTGSTAVGNHLRDLLAGRGAGAQLELGGKNPAVILGDADLELAAQTIARGAFMSAGQKCTAVSRVVVVPEIRDQFLDALVAETEELKVGDPTDQDTDIGPLVDKRALDRQQQAVETAQESGSSLLVGGTQPADVPFSGWYFSPTVIDKVEPGAEIAQEELFGPVLAVLDAQSGDAALGIANDTPYGLTASIYTQDLERAMWFANSCDVGVVKINEPPAGIDPHVPTGGWKASGSGPRELGPDALGFFSKEKTVYVNAGK